MIKIRKSKERGFADHGWLKSYHSFSFADYYDPEQMGFRSLRVINEDKISPSKGFGTHAHKNMEILSYVISGELAHKDSMGNGRTIKAGELQAMSAGSGITHSEFNPSDAQEGHFLQIWLTPREVNLEPSYSEWKPTKSEQKNSLTLLASTDAQNGSVKINQDVFLYLGELQANEEMSVPLNKGRHLWLQMIEGAMALNSTNISSGDGVAISDEKQVSIVAESNSKFLLFDLN